MTNETKAKIEILPSVTAVSQDLTIQSDGKIIKLRKPNWLTRKNFAKASGSEAVNVNLLSEVFHLPYVVEIDGETVFTPTSEIQLNALGVRLGDAHDDIQQSILDNFLGKKPDAESVKNS